MSASSSAAILLAIHDARRRGETAALLRDAGHVVHCAAFAREALRSLSADAPRPRLVVLDAELPDLCAAELLRQLRAHPATADAPVLWLGRSAADLPEGEAGADLILRGPIDPAALRAAVRTLLRLSGASGGREVEAGFRALLDSAPVLIWMSGPDKAGSYFNQKWLEFTGRTLEEELGEGWLEPVHPDDLPALAECQAAWEERRAFTTRFRLRKADGEYRWMLDTGTPRFGPDGAFLGYVGSCVDFTEQVESERLIRAREADFRALFELAAAGAAQADPTTFRIQRVNRKLCEITGYSEEELLGRTLFDLTHPEDRERDLATLSPAVHGKRDTWSVEKRYVRKDGRVVWVQVDGAVVRDRSGSPIRTMGIIQDITERKRVEAEHLRSEARLSGIIGSAMDAIISVDERQEIVVFNAAAERMFGYPAEEIVGQPLALLLPERYRAAHGGYVEEFGATGTTSRSMGSLRPLTARHADGCEFPIEATISQVPVGGSKLFTVIIRDITARRHAENALRESEARLHFALQAGRIGAWEWDIRSGRVAWSEGLEALHGLEPGGFAGTYEAFQALIHPDDRDRVLEAIRRTLEEGAPYELALRSVRPDGKTQWIETRAQLLRDDSSAPVRLVGVSRDVTQQRLAEEALRASEERFRGTFEQAAVGVAHVGLGGRWLRVNQKLCEILGYPREELLQKTFQEITHPEDLAQDLALVERLRSGEIDTYALEKRYVTRDGSAVWAELTVSLGLVNGRPEYYIAVIQDISARRRGEEELQATAARLDRANNRLRVLNEASRAFAELSSDYPRLLRTVVQRTAELIGDTCVLRLVSEDGQRLDSFGVYSTVPDAERLIRMLDAAHPQRVDEGYGGQVLRTGEPLLIPEIAAEDATRQMKPEYRPLRDAVGLTSMLAVPLRGRRRLLGVLMLARHNPPGRSYSEEDLGLLQELGDRAALAIEKARLYHVLETQGRRKDEFLAMLAHELRNPLAPIVTSSEILRLRSDGDPVVRKQREIIERNARHLSRLVDDLLEVSRINEGKISLRTERVDLSQVVEQAVTSTRAAIEERGHHLNVSVPLPPVFLQADPTRLVQVLVNLLNNAAKYTDDGGEISLVAQREQGEAVLRVRDNGRGMDPELQARVFDLFVQGERTLARAEGGLGVGLTLAKRLVEMHHGTIQVHSDGPGLGTEFTVRLPAEPEREPAAAAVPSASAAADGNGRVLLVEDNADAAETLTDLLHLWGYEVRSVRDGRAALSAVPEYEPRIILLDIGLPGMDGYEVARELRKNGSFAGAGLIALTGYGDPEHRQAAEAAGFDHHLIKPVNPEALRALLATLSERLPVPGRTG
ncbi:MAG: PAS domain S-box protein [Armatimonadota bacterium]